MTIVSLKEAKRLGLRYYFTGKPCHKGHIAQRKVVGRICLTCEANKGADYLMRQINFMQKLTSNQ